MANGGSVVCVTRIAFACVDEAIRCGADNLEIGSKKLNTVDLWMNLMENVNETATQKMFKRKGRDGMLE